MSLSEGRERERVDAGVDTSQWTGGRELGGKINPGCAVSSCIDPSIDPVMARPKLRKHVTIHFSLPCKFLCFPSTIGARCFRMALSCGLSLLPQDLVTLAYLISEKQANAHGVAARSSLQRALLPVVRDGSDLFLELFVPGSLVCMAFIHSLLYLNCAEFQYRLLQANTLESPRLLWFIFLHPNLTLAGNDPH